MTLHSGKAVREGVVPSDHLILTAEAAGIGGVSPHGAESDAAQYSEVDRRVAAVHSTGPARNHPVQAVLNRPAHARCGRNAPLGIAGTGETLTELAAYALGRVRHGVSDGADGLDGNDGAQVWPRGHQLLGID